MGILPGVSLPLQDDDQATKHPLETQKRKKKDTIEKVPCCGASSKRPYDTKQTVKARDVGGGHRTSEREEEEVVMDRNREEEKEPQWRLLQRAAKEKTRRMEPDPPTTVAAHSEKQTRRRVAGSP